MGAQGAGAAGVPPHAGKRRGHVRPAGGLPPTPWVHSGEGARRQKTTGGGGREEVVVAYFSRFLLVGFKRPVYARMGDTFLANGT